MISASANTEPHGNQPQWITAPSCTQAQHSESLKQTHPQHKVNSPPPALPPHHLTTWKTLLSCQKEKRTITRGGIPAPSQVKSQKEKTKQNKRGCAEFQQTSSSSVWLADGPQPSRVPLCLLASYPLAASSWIRLRRASAAPLPRSFSPHPFMSIITCAHAARLAEADVHRAETRGLVLADRRL